ncbi:MAG: hypothetical protein IAE99_00555 [Rhodothermales bacterium]|nr:hypothetical protein [Rhodothermales bacterium]
MYRSLLLALALAGAPFVLAPTAVAQTTVRVLDGDWRWAVETPRGPMSGLLRAATNASGQLGIAMSMGSSENGLTSVLNLTRANDRVTFVLPNNDIGNIEVLLNFADSTFYGNVAGNGFDLPINGRRLTWVVPAVATISNRTPLAGRWTYSVEVPGQTVRGFLTFNAVRPDSLTGEVAQEEQPDRKMPVSGLALAPDGTARFWITAPGEIGRVDYIVRVSSPDRLSGSLTAMGYSFDLTGARVAETSASPVAGAWSYALETPNGASSGRIELAADASGTLSGRIVRSSGEVSELSSAALDGDVLTLVYPSARYGSMTMRLAVSDDALTGALLVGQTEMPVRATRIAN